MENGNKSIISARFLSYNLEEFMCDEDILHHIIQGIGYIGSYYSRFLVYSLPILTQIDKMKSSRSAKNQTALNAAIDAFKIKVIGAMDEIDTMKINNSEKYKTITDSYTVYLTSYHYNDHDGFSYNISLKYIKQYLDTLMLHLREMAMTNSVTNWKNHFPDIEKDFRNIYNEIFGCKTIISLAYLTDEAKNDFLYGSSGDSNFSENSIKIKSLSSIATVGKIITLFLENLMLTSSRIAVTIVSSAKISDPNNFEDDIDNPEVDSIGIEFGNSGEDDIEDFINTDN